MRRTAASFAELASARRCRQSCQLCRTGQCKELRAKLKIAVDMGCGHLEVNSRRGDFHMLVHTTLWVRVGILYLFIDAMFYKGIL